LASDGANIRSRSQRGEHSLILPSLSAKQSSRTLAAPDNSK
jgi:hypothetical protein